MYVYVYSAVLTIAQSIALGCDQLDLICPFLFLAIGIIVGGGGQERKTQCIKAPVSVFLFVLHTRHIKAKEKPLPLLLSFSYLFNNSSRTHIPHTHLYTHP
jgi:hypothetical protein